MTLLDEPAVPGAVLEAENLLQARELDAALQAFAAAEVAGADPDRCDAGRWLAFMLQGSFTSAWRASDAIRRRGAPDPHRFWQGEDVRGKRVIVRCLHGFGDTVQFLRYMPALKAMTSRLLLEVPSALLQLASCFDGVGEVITWGADAPEEAPEWDVQMEITELPYFFRTSEAQLPLATRYLRLPEAWLRDVAVEPVCRSSLRVGVVWASGLWNPSRSVAFEEMLPLFACSECEFWNLQGGVERQEWARLPPSERLHAAEACERSIPALAATIAHLDLVITTDTLAAHLAGALGVPAWVMLERAADWRWQHGRADSPWYPTLRLFRQHEGGGWGAVVERIAQELQSAQQRHRRVA